eukprot:3238413-Pyramimonas_sp.AAC.1
MYRQMREAAQSMRRDGTDLPNANLTPPWEYVLDPSPSPDNPNRFGYVPAFFSHQTYDPTSADRPTAAPMDHSLFPDYHAQVSGIPRVGRQPENPCVRATADDFYLSQLTRGSGYASGVPGQMPHYGYLAHPMDQNVQQQAPGLVMPPTMG